MTENWLRSVDGGGHAGAFLTNLFIAFNCIDLRILIARGGYRDFEKGALYVGHHGQNKVGNYKFLVKYVYSIFKFTLFLYTMKAYWWNLINFSKFTNDLIRKE